MGLGDTLYNVRAGQGAHSRSKYGGLAACCPGAPLQPRIVASGVI